MLTPIPKTQCLIGQEYYKELIKLIDSATSNISILMFDWRWYKNDVGCQVSLINHALIRAVRRGVKVRAITNYFNIIETLSEVGILAKPWDARKLMHSKLVLIDKEIAVMGSHNFTQNAMESNVETSMVVIDEENVTQLKEYFERLWSSF